MFCPKSIQVHEGTFHADDVICVVQAKILNKSVEVIRADRDLGGTDLSNNRIVADIGNGLFDHHQNDARTREDGIKHCAASLLWEFWGKDVIELTYVGLSHDNIEQAWKEIDSTFMKTLSIVDNGITLDNPFKLDSTALSVSNIAGNFNPTWNEESDSQSINSSFIEAVEIAEKLFKRYIINSVDTILARKELDNKIKTAKQSNKPNILVLDSYISWENAVANEPSILCVVYPSLRNSWNVQLTSIYLGSFETKISTPKDWRGYRDTNKEKPPFEGMVFCHSNGFISAFREKSLAIKAAEYLVEYNKK